MTIQDLQQASYDAQWLHDARSYVTDETLCLEHPIIAYLDEAFVSALEREVFEKLKQQALAQIKQMEESLHNRGIDFGPPPWKDALPTLHAPPP